LEQEESSCRGDCRLEQIQSYLPAYPGICASDDRTLARKAGDVDVVHGIVINAPRKVAKQIADGQEDMLDCT
jgi:hypothetical protein